MRKASIQVGDKFVTTEGYDVKVVNYTDARNVLIRFNNGYTKTTQASHLKTGRIKNPYHRSVFGIGYNGSGKYRPNDKNGNTTVYRLWRYMVRRCYSTEQLEKYPTYRECYVCDEWHNFQNFAEWYEQQPKSTELNFDLDKDLRVIGNKVYSPDTCSLVPHRINTVLNDNNLKRGQWPVGVYYHKKRECFVSRVNQGNGKQRFLGYYKTPEEAFLVYKIEKEKTVKELAKKYKGYLHPQVYENLMNYYVEPY